MNPVTLTTFGLLAAHLVALAFRTHDDTTAALVVSSLLMFGCSFASAVHLLGGKAALRFVAIAAVLGWFAEQMGATHGWFFGDYDYTDVLGPRIGAVPAVIPMMWFSLTYMGYVIANLIVWRAPVDGSPHLSDAVVLTLLAAMVVTAFDLGADPYFVYTLKAWIMVEKDGWWFGETVQGFFGWMFVSFCIVFLFRLTLRGTPPQPWSPVSRRHALVPVAMYAGFMVFQMCVSHPMELRTIAFFAMGMPILCALAGWRQWQRVPAVPVVPANARAPSDADLDRMQVTADPLADDTVSAVLGPWSDTGIAERLARIGTLNRLIAGWKTNADLDGWRAAGEGVSPEMAAALEAYVQAGRVLPAWADAAKIDRAETLFFEQGPLSCLLLFCRSLPECYVVPDLSAVLQVAGQLTQHTDYRVRSTAAMIFPVMMDGGLTTPQGGGVAQILKVRLIHATIRHLILRGDPAQATGVVPPLPQYASARSMHEALLGHGWNVDADGLPCNQEELAYTLLTFGHCFLSSLHRLNLGLGADDEAAYLHAWNVVGHVLGIRPALMVDTTPEAQQLFARMQARGRADPVSPDPRPALGAALMNAMAAVIPFAVAKPVPTLMTRHLCGPVTSHDLGLDGQVSWFSRALFAVGMGLVGLIDGTARLVWPSFSLSRFVVRVLGYHVVTQLLMDQTRPLQLPDHLLSRVQGVVAAWSDDPKAPHWLNVMEDRFTTTGAWKSGIRR